MSEWGSHGESGGSGAHLAHLSEPVLVGAGLGDCGRIGAHQGEYG